MIPDTLDYVAVCSTCQGISAWVANDPAWAKDTAKEVARWIKDGRDVQRMMTSETRTRKFCRGHNRQLKLAADAQHDKGAAL